MADTDMKFQEFCARHGAQMDGLISSAKSGVVISNTENIFRLLFEHGYAVEMFLHPDKVAVHPRNRGGFGISAKDTHALGDNFASQGYSPLLGRAICFECGPNAKKVDEFNKRLSDESEGLARMRFDAHRKTSIVTHFTL